MVLVKNLENQAKKWNNTAAHDSCQESRSSFKKRSKTRLDFLKIFERESKAFVRVGCYINCYKGGIKKDSRLVSFTNQSSSVTKKTENFHRKI